MLTISASLAIAGGPVPYGPGACGPAAAPYGNPCAYWGDAPFPGFCGGVVALPFLVVGSLLGGNPTGPCGPPPSPRYGCVQYPSPNRYYGPPPPMGSPLFGAIPGADVCTGLFGSVMGGAGLIN